jgi:Flp pilus assembly protein TadG
MIDNYRRARARRQRGEKGALIVELTAALFLLLFFVILSVHIGIIVYGAFLNDRACRDAVRAAAQAKTPAIATSQATAVLVSHKQGANSYLSSPVLVVPIVYQGSAPDAQTSPYVQVTTTTTVKLPFPAMNFLSLVFNADSNFTFSQTYTFPIVLVN